MKKKFIHSYIGFIICIILLVVIPSESVFAASNGFQVSGTTLYDGNGKEFVMRGVNYPHAWFPSEYKTAIPAIANKGFNCIRIVVSNGQKWSKTNYNELQELISICKQNRLVAILEVHDTTGADDTYSLEQAVNYWIEMKSLLQQNENYVIVNIANEWYGTWDDGTSWKNGYIFAIRKLREAGINNTFIVDCAGWGQYPQVIFDHGSSVLQADVKNNTMFSIHMYEYAGGNSDIVKNNMNQVLNKNLCLTIGEFGGYHSNGDVDEDEIMRSGRAKNVGWIAWSWKGNSSDLNYLDLSYDWNGNTLTHFGNRVIYGTDGVQETSNICSIFSNNK